MNFTHNTNKIIYHTEALSTNYDHKLMQMLEQQTNPSGPHPVSQSRTSEQTGPGIEAETLTDKETMTLSICHVFNAVSEMSPSVERDKALSLLMKVFVAREGIALERDPSTLTCIANASATLANMGVWKAAEDLGVRVLAMRRQG
jgi:hypothetical protein